MYSIGPAVPLLAPAALPVPPPPAAPVVPYHRGQFRPPTYRQLGSCFLLLRCRGLCVRLFPVWLHPVASAAPSDDDDGVGVTLGTFPPIRFPFSVGHSVGNPAVHPLLIEVSALDCPF